MTYTVTDTLSMTSRRSFLRASAGLVAASALPFGAQAREIEPAAWQTVVEHSVQPLPRARPERLYVKSQRTGEVFNDIIEENGLIFEDALGEIDHLMRDWRRDETITIDRDLIGLLARIQSEIGYDEPMTVISGYRSQSTNDMLRRRMSKVAKNSYHIRGMAVDLRIKGMSTGAVRQIALHEGRGGVGWYPSRRFIHLDTGPIRTWRG